MTNPCENCSVKIDQSILYDEVSCFRTCTEFKKWRSGRDNKD